MQKNIYGKKGEIIASNYLKKAGLKILQYNYKKHTLMKVQKQPLSKEIILYTISLSQTFL